MHWLLLLGFVAAHLLLYLAVFRNLRLFTGERMILAYHGLAFGVVFAVLIAAFARGTIGFAAASGLLALQFIYSVSFLELWSLAQGSYSLQILARVSRQMSASREQVLATCEAIGAEKKQHRLDNLLTFKLATRTADGRIALSMVGSTLVGLLRTIMRFATIRHAD